MKETIKLADIARSLAIRPETARAKVRRQYKHGTPRGFPKPIGRWEFKAEDRAAVRSLLIAQ